MDCGGATVDPFTTSGTPAGPLGPKHGHRRQGGSKITFVDTLRKDKGL